MNTSINFTDYGTYRYTLIANRAAADYEKAKRSLKYRSGKAAVATKEGYADASYLRDKAGDACVIKQAAEAFLEKARDGVKACEAITAKAAAGVPATADNDTALLDYLFKQTFANS